MFPDAAIEYLMKPTLTLTRGIPGSGKTTWAKQQDAVRANRDDLRMAMFGRYFGLSFQQEELITKAQREIARVALLAGRNVVVDDMNLRPKYIRPWNEFAIEHGATFLLQEFPVDVDTCILRDYHRKERQVGEEVIRDIARKYLPKGQFLPYTPIDVTTESVDVVERVEGLLEVLLVDIDGTMTTGPYNRGPYEFAKVGQDLPRWPIVNLVGRYLENGGRVIFMSGRENSCRDETRMWLFRHLPEDTHLQWGLFMRKTGDGRADSIVKRELFDAHVRGVFNVDLVLDDRDSVVKMWRSLGLTCAQVDYGNF